MTNAHKFIETGLPFSGFYDSDHSAMLDDALAQVFSDESGDNAAIPFYNESGAPDIDWQLIFSAYNALYVEALLDFFEEATGLPLHRFTLPESLEMSSPREYNFSTDRLFIKIRKGAARLMLRYSRESDNHAILAAHIKERFTSYDGFISFYSNHLDDWLEKPVQQWDHNELGTLFEACLMISANDLAQHETVFDAYELLENARCNGKIDNCIDAGLPAIYHDYCHDCRDADISADNWPLFTDWQAWRDAGQPCALPALADWLENPENAASLPAPRCPHTLSLAI